MSLYWASNLKNSKEINFCCLSHSPLNFMWQSYSTLIKITKYCSHLYQIYKLLDLQCLADSYQKRSRDYAS